MLRSQAILRNSAETPLVDFHGRPMPWIYYQWATSLTHEGATLAADCLLHRLQQFESTQIASYGMTGIPLVTSVLVQGEGRYSGLCLRPKPEPHGTRRQIEGTGDKTKPVVLIDDCICSGASLHKAFTILETEGYRVEGALCVAEFPWQGGMDWARALGYRVEALFNVWTDLEAPESNPPAGHRRISPEWDTSYRIADGLPPAAVARHVIQHFFATGAAPLPPFRFDREYNASGGVIVSLRNCSTDRRLARDGFYHLVPGDADMGRDVVLATLLAVRSAKLDASSYDMDHVKIGVTLFEDHEEITPTKLDYARYGILVRSKVHPWKSSGALPNTQFFNSEIEQLHHACRTNARISSTEPYSLYRHTVTKSVENGQDWPPYGVSQQENSLADIPPFGDALVQRVREAISAFCACEPISGAPLPENLLQQTIYGAAVSLYHHGKLVGCWTSAQGTLDTMLIDAAEKAWKDERYAESKSALSLSSLEEMAVLVSVFVGRERLGPITQEQASQRLRLGRDTLLAYQGKQSAIMLSFIPCQYDWSKQKMAQSVLAKSSLSDPPDGWIFYNTRCWLAHAGQVGPLDFGYLVRNSGAMPNIESDIRLLSDYLRDKIGDDGLPAYVYYPVFNTETAKGTAARIILALDAMISAGRLLNAPELCEAGINGLAFCCDHISERSSPLTLNIPEMECGIAADVMLVSALYRAQAEDILHRPQVKGLVARLGTIFHADGAITWQKPGQRIGADHDLFPGAALYMAVQNRVQNERRFRFKMNTDSV